MSIEQYNLMKSLYERTKPIRGRSHEVRPISDRRRDWEQVVQDGDKYGAKLYNTNCVMYCPNGDIEFQSDSWATPTTASFISRYAPYQIMSFKRYNRLWLRLNTTATCDGEAYPIPEKGIFIVKFVDGKYVPAEIPKVMQRVTDRTKSRNVRLPVESFRNYCKNMLKLADGWVRDELVQQFQSAGDTDYWGRGKILFRGNAYNSCSFSGQVSKDTAKRLYDFMSTATEDEYPNLLVLIALATNSEDSNVVRQVDIGEGRMRDVREFKYRPQSVLTRIDYICKQANDVSKVVEVEAGKVMTNVV
jgi:hypothetical protein